MNLYYYHDRLIELEENEVEDKSIRNVFKLLDNIEKKKVCLLTMIFSNKSIQKRIDIQQTLFVGQKNGYKKMILVNEDGWWTNIDQDYIKNIVSELDDGLTISQYLFIDKDKEEIVKCKQEEFIKQAKDYVETKKQFYNSIF